MQPAKATPPPWSPESQQTESALFNLLLFILFAALLTGLSLPAYRGFALHVHNRLARSVLEDALQREHEWSKLPTWQGFYSLEAVDYPSPAVYVSSDGSVRGSANSGSIYRVSVAFPAIAAPETCGLVGDDPGTGFVLVAEPVQTQLIDSRCGRLCLSSSGRHGASGDAGAEACWSETKGS